MSEDRNIIVEKLDDKDTSIKDHEKEENISIRNKAFQLHSIR